jgi:hypothetical protein
MAMQGNVNRRLVRILCVLTNGGSRLSCLPASVCKTKNQTERVSRSVVSYGKIEGKKVKIDLLDHPPLPCLGLVVLMSVEMGGNNSLSQRTKNEATTSHTDRQFAFARFKQHTGSYTRLCSRLDNQSDASD